MNNQRYLTVQEAARELEAAETTVRSAISQARLPHTVMFGRKLISWPDLEAYRQRTRPDGKKPRGRPRMAAKPRQTEGGE